MKSLSSLLVALTFFTITNLVALKSSSAHSYASQIVNSGVSLNQQISSNSLNSSSGVTQGQFIINKSGRYFLSTDINAKPGASNIPCIYINSSNVILDLGGKTLTLSSSATQKNISAVEVASNKSNITIMNGTLNGKAAYSSIYTTTGIMVNAGVSNLLIENVRITNFGERAIVCNNGCSEIVFNNVNTYNNGTQSNYASRSVTLSFCNNISIEDSSFNNTNSRCQNSTYGLYLLDCTNINLNNLQILNTTASQGFTRGIWFVNCIGATCNNVKVTGVSVGSNSTYGVIGIDLVKTTDSSFLNCSTSDCLATNYTTSSYGFKLSYGSNSNEFVNCFSRNNIGGGTTSGFKLTSSSFNTFTDCTALANGGASRLAFGFHSGLAGEILYTSTGNVFKRCKSIGTTANAGNAYGFCLSAETASSIEHCQAQATRAGGVSFGIALYTNCLKNIIEFNTMNSNIGKNGAYGFKSFDTNNRSLLRGNLAFAHGQSLSSDGTTLLSDTGFMNYYFTYTDPSLNPAYQIKEYDLSRINQLNTTSETWSNVSITQSVLS